MKDKSNSTKENRKESPGKGESMCKASLCSWNHREFGSREVARRRDGTVGKEFGGAQALSEQLCHDSFQMLEAKH